MRVNPLYSLCLALLALPACHKASPEAVSTVQAVPVTLGPAISGPIRPVIAATGQVKPAAGAELLVMPPQDARIAELTKSVGDRVRRGELLVRFQIPSLEADAATKRSDLARAEAQLRTAQQNVTRLSGLLQRGIAARKEVEDAQRDLALANATVNEARSTTSAAGQLAGREVVRAPFDGVVVARSHQVGDMVSAGGPDPLLRVIDPSRLQVEASVPAGDLGRVATGNQATVRGAAFPDEKAHVIARPPSVDPASGTALVRLAFDTPTRRPAGLAVAVEIYCQEHQAAVLISADALVQEGTASYVFVIDGPKGQKKAHRRQVTVGVVAQGQAEILSGVKAGESVVVRGQTALPDGATVEATDSTATAEPAK
ncbi:MAG TPA: efflux RND transporter periplasmic adaptor subunit [Thermoanaerobaculia bacterium]|nr:efflux RND transporter periplasmic adaptor subunit [Thermoanaerobaculia bacterium]